MKPAILIEIKELETDYAEIILVTYDISNANFMAEIKKAELIANEFGLTRMCGNIWESNEIKLFSWATLVDL